MTSASEIKKTSAQSAADKRQSHANGLRAAREAKGYGRERCAKALSLSTSEWWNIEFSGEPNSAEVEVMLKRVNALP